MQREGVRRVGDMVGGGAGVVPGKAERDVLH